MKVTGSLTNSQQQIPVQILTLHFISEKNYQPIPCTDATIGQVSKMKPNQRMNMSGTLSLGDQKPKEVMIKSVQKKSYLKD